jgi:hypothetical protein
VNLARRSKSHGGGLGAWTSDDERRLVLPAGGLLPHEKKLGFLKAAKRLATPGEHTRGRDSQRAFG